MEYTDIKNKSERELHDALVEARNKVRTLQFKVAAAELKDVREIRETRKVIAQILTTLNTRASINRQIDSN